MCLLACVAGGIRERASGRAAIFPPWQSPRGNSTLHQSSHGFATRVHGFATKTKALAREIPSANAGYTYCEKCLKNDNHNISFGDKICSDISPWTFRVPQSSYKCLRTDNVRRQWKLLLGCTSPLSRPVPGPSPELTAAFPSLSEYSENNANQHYK